MIEKKIEVCNGTDRAKFLRARLSLLVIDGATVLSEQYHSINIEPGENLSDVRARVEAHLAQPEAVSAIPGAPWPKIPDSEWADVEAHVAIVHKPAVVAAHRAKARRPLTP